MQYKYMRREKKDFQVKFITLYHVIKGKWK